MAMPVPIRGTNYYIIMKDVIAIIKINYNIMIQWWNDYMLICLDNKLLITLQHIVIVSGQYTPI